MTYWEILQELPFYYVGFLVLITGLIIGSFLNVVILRGLSDESIVLPPSKCPKCGNRLKWYHNIPVFSYLFLRGKCAFCKEKISIQYPLVEAFTALTFVAIFYVFQFSLNTIFCWIFASLIIVLSVCDLKEHTILTGHTYALAAVGLVYNFFNINGGVGYTNFVNSLIGLIGGFLLMYLFIKLLQLITKKECFGNGEPYILGAIGAVVGYKLMLLTLPLAAIMQAIISLPYLWFINFKQKKYGVLAAWLGFILLLAGYFIFYSFLMQNTIVFWIYWLIILWVTLSIVHASFEDIKQGNGIEIPFGPALLIAATLLFIFSHFNLYTILD